MSLSNLYKVTSRTETPGVGSKTIEIRIDKEHEIFEGHFPDNPVMPGVCMMHIVKEITASYVNRELFMEKCSNVKFISLINPEIDDLLKLEIDIQEVDQKIKIKSNTYFQGKQALKMSVIYRIIE